MTEQRGDSIKWKYQIIIAQQKCGTHRIKMFLNLLKKIKWKLTDSLKEKIVDLAKKGCTGQCIYGKYIYEFEKDGSKQSSPE